MGDDPGLDMMGLDMGLDVALDVGTGQGEPDNGRGLALALALVWLMTMAWHAPRRRASHKDEERVKCTIIVQCACFFTDAEAIWPGRRGKKAPSGGILGH